MRCISPALALLLASGCYAAHSRDADAGRDAGAPGCVEGAACDDGDPCTFPDRCRAGACVGTPRLCAPPGPCRAAPGACVDGACMYDVLEDGTACDDGDPCTAADACAAGACAGEALRCDAPPPPECVDARTRRTFGAGACEAGACRYVPEDADCPSGCIEGACCEPQPWTVADVDPGPPAIGGPGPQAMAIDASGGVHIVFRHEVTGPGAERQMYAHRPPGGAWTVESIGRGRGIAVMGVDPEGAVHALYQHPDDPAQLVHALRPPASGWTLTDVEPPEPTRPWDRLDAVQMEIDASGALHVFLGAHTGALYLHRSPDGSWTFSTPFASPDFGSVMRMARAPDGTIHALFLGQHRVVWHAQRGPGEPWVLAPLEEEAPDDLYGYLLAGRLLLDPSGGMHIVRLDLVPAGLLYLHRSAGGVWTSEVVDALGPRTSQNTSIAIDGAGVIHIAYIPEAAGGDQRIGYARREPSGVWSIESVDADNDLFEPFWVAIAADDRGGAHIAFADYPMPLRYAYRRLCPALDP